MPIGGTGFFGGNQSPRVTSVYMNSNGRKGDPAPGVPVSTAQASGSIVQAYYGFLGGKVTLDQQWAQTMADPTVGPLYGGIYQYVQFAAADATQAARGRVVYWLDEINYIVTTNSATPPSKIAGVCLNGTLQGNFDFMQIAGLASVLFSGTVAIGGMVQATAGQGATVATVGLTSIGMAVMVAGAAGAVSPVQLNIQAGYNF